jgi:curved DNA-binding protein CbpA
MGDKEAALKVLGLGSDASDDEIRAAFRRINSQW